MPIESEEEKRRKARISNPVLPTPPVSKKAVPDDKEESSSKIGRIANWLKRRKSE